MRRFVIVCMFWLLSTLQVSWTGAVWGADEAPPETKPASGLAIWDTGKPSAAASRRQFCLPERTGMLFPWKRPSTLSRATLS